MKRVSLSTFLFLLGCFVAVLAAGLQWIIPGNQLVLFLVAVGGVALAAWQKFRGDYEQRQQLEQERKRSDAVAQDYAIRHSELRISRNLHKAPDSMPGSKSQSF